MQLAAEQDAAGAHALYHDDAVLEFPQSGERFEGLENFREWHARYPVEVEFRVRRIAGSGDVWVRELSVRDVRDDDGTWTLVVGVIEFRDDRIARERIYYSDTWEAPEWRAHWRSPTMAV